MIEIGIEQQIKKKEGFSYFLICYNCLRHIWTDI